MSSPASSTPAAPGHPALLAQITADLAGGADPTAVLRQFLPSMVAVCGAEAGVMRVLAADGRGFDLVADQGLPPDLRLLEMAVDADCGVCGKVAGSLEVGWSDAGNACARRHPHPFLAAPGRRVLAVPLAHRARALGVCSLFFGPGADVSAQVMALLKTLGEVMGLALHGARMEAEALRAAVMAERQLMAAEVHDTIAQTLSFAKMRLPLLAAAIDRSDRDSAARFMGDLRSAVGDAHAGLRDVLSHLREPVDAADLRHTVDLGREVLRAQAEVALEVHDEVPELQLPPLQAHQVQRIVQEALTNIARHAGARHAWLTITRQGPELEIRVDDDGRGLPEAPPGAAQHHFGLDIMRQRAALLGGDIEIARRQEGGTRVRLHFPVDGEAA